MGQRYDPLSSARLLVGGEKSPHPCSNSCPIGWTPILIAIPMEVMAEGSRRDGIKEYNF